MFKPGTKVKHVLWDGELLLEVVGPTEGKRSLTDCRILENRPESSKQDEDMQVGNILPFTTDFLYPAEEDE